MFKIFLLTVFSLFVGVTPLWAKISCPPQPEGDIDVSWHSDKIEYDFRKTQTQMNNMQNDTVNPFGDHVKTHVGGLMKGGIGMESQIQISTLSFPRERMICQWVGRMTVNVKIDPKIYIARQHKKGSCRHKAILDHEMKHIFVDREIVKKYVGILKKELQKAARDVGIVGPKRNIDQKRYQTKISEHMERILKQVMDDMYAERRDKQQAVDTKEEYERVAGLCG